MNEWVFQAIIRVTLLLAGVLGAWRWVPLSDPALRRRTLLFVSVLVMVAPWMAGWWGLSLPSAGGAATRLAFGGSGGWPSAVGGIWAVGSLVCLTRIVRQSFGLRRLIGRSQPIDPADIATGETAPGLSASHVLPVRVSAEISGPCVAGVWRPVLLVPARARHWPADHWHMVLAHETQHVRQRDLIAGWLPRLVLAVYWWHPLAHWLVRQFHLESEALCDRAVVNAQRGIRNYVELLLSLDGARLPRLAIPMGRGSSLSHRIERMVLFSKRRPGPLAVAAALGLTALIAIVALSVRTRSPSAVPLTVPEDLSADAVVRLSASPFPGDR